MVLGIFIGAFSSIFLFMLIINFSGNKANAKRFDISNDLLRKRVENGERAACALETVVAHFTSANPGSTEIFTPFKNESDITPICASCGTEMVHTCPKCEL